MFLAIYTFFLQIGSIILFYEIVVDHHQEGKQHHRRLHMLVCRLLGLNSRLPRRHHVLHVIIMQCNAYFTKFRSEELYFQNDRNQDDMVRCGAYMQCCCMSVLMCLQIDGGAMQFI